MPEHAIIINTDKDTPEHVVMAKLCQNTLINSDKKWLLLFFLLYKTWPCAVIKKKWKLTLIT
jgi:hypothetical protein